MCCKNSKNQNSTLALRTRTLIYSLHHHISIYLIKMFMFSIISVYKEKLYYLYMKYIM